MTSSAQRMSCWIRKSILHLLKIQKLNFSISWQVRPKHMSTAWETMRESILSRSSGKACINNRRLIVRFGRRNVKDRLWNQLFTIASNILNRTRRNQVSKLHQRTKLRFVDRQLYQSSTKNQMKLLMAVWTNLRSSSCQQAQSINHKEWRTGTPKSWIMSSIIRPASNLYQWSVP